MASTDTEAECGSADCWYPPDVPPDSYIFTATQARLPENPLLMPTVGNGHLATVVYRDRLFMNGLYNGAGKKSHRAAVPAMNRVKVPPVKDSEDCDVYSMDCIRGVFTHTQTREGATLVHSVYSHKTIPSLVVNQISIMRSETGGTAKPDIFIELECGTDFLSPDMTLERSTEGQSVEYFTGCILETEVKGDETVQIRKVYICMDELPAVVKLGSGERLAHYSFIMSVNSSLEHCIYQFNKGRQEATEGTLLSSHCTAWIDQWQMGRIDVWCEELSTRQVVYACQYYLLSSLPSPAYSEDCVVAEFYGLSPESLAYGDMSHDDYLGHVFWDQETWMYSPLLILFPHLALQLLQSRLRVVGQALRNASRNNLHGAQFPWEQGVTGIPVSPSDDCEAFEVHINADIAFAIRQYSYATGPVSSDLALLASYLAKFWLSRLTWLEDKKMYGVMGVMPPDEFHYPVDNSAYTNVAAQLAVKLPEDLRFISKSPSNMSKCADTSVSESVEIYVPFDEKRKYHPEYDGYDIDDPQSNEVKQADVILIGFPLGKQADATVRRNDLEMYEQVTTSDGPAMTWGMFCIGHLELNQTEKAAQMFNKQLLHSTSPFQVWTEYPHLKGAINFITGMGSFLQSLLYGYVGVRLCPASLTIRPSLPCNWTRLKVVGLSYMDTRFDVDVSTSSLDNSSPRLIHTSIHRKHGNNANEFSTEESSDAAGVSTFTIKLLK